MRWRLRALFIALMVAGLGWIYLGNWVRTGATPWTYSLTETGLFWGGALAIGLLLDAGAGLHLRRFFGALARRGTLDPGQLHQAALRAIRFPIRASLLLLTSSVVMIAIHRAFLYAGRWAQLVDSPVIRTRFLNSVARDLVLTMILSLLLYIFSRRVLRPAVAQLGLKQMPPEADGRVPVGTRLSLVVLALGILNITMLVGAPIDVPTGRLFLYYLLPVLMSTLVAYLVAADIGRDLKAIAGRLQVLASGMRPDLYGRFAVTELDEVGDLVASINTLQDRVEREFQSIERDLDAARSIQMGLLPRSWQPPPGWDLAATLLPVQEVGGDFYDLIDLGSGRFGVAVGDASGKGLPAALLMASTVSLIRSHAPLHPQPAAVLAAVNRLLAANLPPMNFVTALYAVVDTHRLEVTVASAGHLPPVLGGCEAETLPSLPLGIDSDVVYEERTYSLAPGRPVLLFSDGLIEAANRDGALLDSGWSDRALAGAPRPARQVMQQVLGELRTHLNGLAPADDVTLLVLLPPTALELVLPSAYGSEVTAAAEAARFARAAGLGRRADEIATAVGEGCLNAITHGNGLVPEWPVTIRFESQGEGLLVTIADQGAPFTPPAASPDLAAQMAGDGEIRGWGLHLIRSLADRVWLEPAANGKQLCLYFGGEHRAE